MEGRVLVYAAPCEHKAGTHVAGMPPHFTAFCPPPTHLHHHCRFLGRLVNAVLGELGAVDDDVVVRDGQHAPLHGAAIVATHAHDVVVVGGKANAHDVRAVAHISPAARGRKNGREMKCEGCIRLVEGEEPIIPQSQKLPSDIPSSPSAGNLYFHPLHPPTLLAPSLLPAGCLLHHARVVEEADLAVV